MILGWFNPLTNRIVPMDDPGIEMVMPREVLCYMVEKEKGDKRHSGDSITVTSSMGCARAMGINRMLPTNPDPQKMWPMTGGTMIHKPLAEMYENSEDWWTEEKYPEKCSFIGEIDGVKMGCLLDLVKRDYSKIWDWKTSFKDKTKWLKVGDRSSTTNPWNSSYAVQLNLGAELVQQQEQRDMSEAELAAWIVSGRWQKVLCDRASVLECLNAEVGTGKYTKGRRWKYGEVLDHVKRMFEMWREAAIPYNGQLEEVPLDKRREIIRGLPMFGESMFNNAKGGNMCTDYCAVRKDCMNIGGGL